MANKYREYLDEWAESDCKQKVNEHAELFPNCACENAEASENGGHGPIEGDEILRFFITSTSVINLKKRRTEESRKLRAASVSRIFSVGLSTVRLKKCTPEEMRLTASILRDGMVQQDPEYGGIFAVADFKCEEVRGIQILTPESGREICVLDTPLDRKENGGFDRPSHADVVCAKKSMSDLDQKKLKEAVVKLFAAGQTGIDEVDEGKLAEFRPQILPR